MKSFRTILTFAIITLFVNVSFAEVIRLEPTEKNEIKLSDKKDVYNKNLVIKDKNIIEDLIQMQKEEEVKDIELLWRTTIDNN